LILYILLVNQGRQLIVAIPLAYIITFTLLSKKKKLLFMLPMYFIGAVGFLLVGLMYLKNTEFLNNYILLFSDIYDGGYLVESSRAYTISIILSDVGLLGNGALSQMYHGGFSSIYGEFFYLSDVGIMGTIFRYGIISAFYISITVMLLYGIFKRAKLCGKEYSGSLISAVFLLLILWPTGAIIEYKGAVLGLILSLSVLGTRRVNLSN
jgi:hypothetical protein